MNVRKLVKSGAASHTVSLPKTWIQKNKLKRGDLIYIEENNNNIIIYPKEHEKKETEKKEITITTKNKDISTLRRETISAYINNYSIFTFIGEDLNKNIDSIKKILDNFLALEIVEQTGTKLVAKDFLNLEEFSLENTIRRMDMLTRSIIIDSKKGSSESEALEKRDFEVDKLFFLMSRLIRSNLADPDSDKNKVEALSTWWLAKNLESTADFAKKISKEFSKDIKDIYEEIEEYYKGCIKAYFKRDKELADKMIAARPELLDKCDKIKKPVKEQLKAMISSSRNVAKIILDS